MTPASGFAATGMQIERKPGQNTDFSVRCDQNWSICQIGYQGKSKGYKF
jgi:hypothetical protein